MSFTGLQGNVSPMTTASATARPRPNAKQGRPTKGQPAKGQPAKGQSAKGQSAQGRSASGRPASTKRQAASKPPQGLRSTASTLALALAGLGLGLVVGIQWITRSSLSGEGALFIELSRWAALLGTYASLLVILLIARVPAIERGIGHDRMVAWHRRLGPLALILIAAHVVLVTTGYASSEAVTYLSESWSLISTYQWILPAAAGFILMMVAGLTSWRVARRRMSYETWWVTHLYLYLAIALAYMHQITLGQAFITHSWARWVWIGFYVITFGALIGYRVVRPVYLSLRHDLRVYSVERESADTVSVWISGRNVQNIGARGGQFFGWRFMTRDQWWQSHPYSLSAAPDPRYLRITVRDLGDHSSSLAKLKHGTRVVAEGPYGVFTADARKGDHVVLIAGGVGITPLRALLDDLPKKVRVDVLYRAPKPEALVLHDELDAIAKARPGTRVRYLVGTRRDYPISAKSLVHLVSDIAGADIYTCGPAELLASVRHAADVLGIPEERVHDEAFSFHSPDTYLPVSSRTKEKKR